MYALAAFVPARFSAASKQTNGNRLIVSCRHNSARIAAFHFCEKPRFSIRIFLNSLKAPQYEQLKDQQTNQRQAERGKQPYIAKQKKHQ